jgi:type II secretory pathway pseudopilin PulG
MIKNLVTIKRNNRAVDKSESGLSIVEIIVSLAIASIIGVAVLFILSTSYQARQQDQIITSKLTDTAIMKQALNKSASMAGAIVIPTASSASNNLTTFLGYSAFGSLSSSGVNSSLSTVELPTPPISVTSSTVSIYWIGDNNGGQELCHGTLSISGDLLQYNVDSENYSGASSTCTPSGRTTAEADFLIGTGWSFRPTLQIGSDCLGPAFNGQTADALVAIKSPMAGTSATSSTASTQVSICLPNWNQ